MIGTSFQRMSVAAVLALTLASSNILGSAAFSPQQPSSHGTPVASTTDRSMKTVQSATVQSSDPQAGAYGEEGRKSRRTVYTHDDWVRHRDSNRFLRNLKSLPNSGVYRNVGNEVISATIFASALIGWNCLMGEYQDFEGVKHLGMLHETGLPVLSLPLTPFTLASPSLGLLLVFRTNTSYKRWDEARKNWGMNINHTRDLVRMGNAYYDRSLATPERREEDLNRLALCTWAFVRSMKRHLSPEWEDEEDFKKELYAKLPREQADRIINAAHRPNCALQDLSLSIENLPMHFMRKNEIHQAVTIFEDNLGSSERLLSSPVPVFYSRHLARYISIWLLLLPLALWSPLGNSWNHLDLIPITAVLSVFLYGIEELATQLEEPFTILPMQAFCDKIYNWCFEIVSFTPGDNGMPVYTHEDNYGKIEPVVEKPKPAPVVETPEPVVTEREPVMNVEADMTVEDGKKKTGFRAAVKRAIGRQ